MALHKPASYLTYDTDARDEMDWNPEWSRRARGFATYAAIRQLGREGIAGIVERCCDCAKQIVLGIGELPGAEVVCEPIINQGMVRFLNERPGATDADHDARTDAVIQKILESGEALFSPTTWQGKRCMRVSVSSWRTDEDDVVRTVAAVRRCLQT
jgi:glutamate/tyrosine decarboxylase-like PLP-dependent enzyme